MSTRSSRAGSSSVSSDNQPASWIVSSRSFNSASTARSASLTGDDLPLIQLLGVPRKVSSANAPPSRTAAARRSHTSTRSTPRSPAGNGQSLHAQGRGIGAETELQIVGGRQRAEHLDRFPAMGTLLTG